MNELPFDFDNLLKFAVEKRIEELVKKEIEKAKTAIDKLIPEVVSGIAITIANRIKVETLGNEVLIHVNIKRMED